jgi:hypothetical protein
MNGDLTTSHGGGFWNLGNDSVNRVLVQIKTDLNTLIESNLVEKMASITNRVTKLEKLRKALKE